MGGVGVLAEEEIDILRGTNLAYRVFDHSDVFNNNQFTRTLVRSGRVS